MIRNLLPEEDVLDDPDDDEADPTLPGDLWYLSQRECLGAVVYSQAFVPTLARNYATWRSIRMLMND